MIILSKKTEMTMELIEELIEEHQKLQKRYKSLELLYKGNGQILESENKKNKKKSNKIVFNFAKYIVDISTSYFIGTPLKINNEDSKINEYIRVLNKYNNQEDQNIELSKLCSIYGHAYELVYMDEDANIGITNISPREAFIVYDDSIIPRPLFGIRYYENMKGEIEGSYFDKDSVNHFIKKEDKYKLMEKNEHYFEQVPLIEYLENEERIGAFETVETLINAHTEITSGLMDDIKIFSEEDSDIKKLEVLKTKENLIDRLEKLIFQLSMVVDTSEKNLGNLNEAAIAYKFQGMANCASIKERKFINGFTRRYELIANIPVSELDEEECKKLKYEFTRTIPKLIKN